MQISRNLTLQRAPIHLRRLIETFQFYPHMFYNRPPAERQFFLNQLMNWMDRLFSPNQPPMAYRLRAVTLSLPEQRRLEIEILRYVREFIFSPEPVIETPSSEDWFAYAYLRQLI